MRVYKDGTSYKFDESTLWQNPSEEEDREQRSIEKSERETAVEPTTTSSNTNASSLVEWISQERFPLFVKITRGRFSHLMSTKKLLVIMPCVCWYQVQVLYT